jgi:hypothetical protein
MLLCLLPVAAELLEPKNNGYLDERLESILGKAGFLPVYVQVGKRNFECEQLDFAK